MAKYSYLYQYIIDVPKYGIKKGNTDFFDKKKGDELVKKKYVKFVGKYAMMYEPGKGTVLKQV